VGPITLFVLATVSGVLIGLWLAGAFFGGGSTSATVLATGRHPSGVAGATSAQSSEADAAAAGAAAAAAALPGILHGLEPTERAALLDLAVRLNTSLAGAASSLAAALPSAAPQLLPSPTPPPPPPSPPPTPPPSSLPSFDASDALSLLRAHVRNGTRQCKRTYFDVYPDWVLARDVTHDECPDISASVASATRAPRPGGNDGRKSELRPSSRVFSPFPEIKNCRLRWFTPEEACDVIERTGHLVMVGDSLVRHIATALFMIMTSNYKYGGTRNAENDPVAWGECTCDGQFGGSSICHSTPGMIAEFFEVTKGIPQTSVICPNWNTQRLHFLPSFGTLYPHEAMDRILSTAAANGGRVTIYQSNGIGYLPAPTAPQDRIDTVAAYKQSWGPTLERVARYNGTRLLVGTVLAHHGFYPCQTREALDVYNDWLRSIALNNSDLDVDVFDGRRLTAELLSFDMVHFLSHDNVFLAQVLLNFLSKGGGDDGESRGRGRGRGRGRTRPAQVSLPDLGHRPLTFRDFPEYTLYQQEAVPWPSTPWKTPTEMDFWIAPEYDLRGCKCYKNWRQRVGTNTSICHCKGWCPPAVTPETLTYDLYPGCVSQTNGYPLSDRSGGARLTCMYTCRDGKSEWEHANCGPPGTAGGGGGAPVTSSPAGSADARLEAATPDLNDPHPCPYPEDRCRNCPWKMMSPSPEPAAKGEGRVMR
jgi:hypothetical protein